MDVRLPDGTILRGVPEGTTREQVIAKVRRFNPELGTQMLNATADLPAQGTNLTESGFNAAMIGAGRATERLARGAQDIFASIAGDEETQQRIAEEEAESARLYQTAQAERPIATAVGGALPYFAVPVGAVGGVAGKALGAVPKMARAGQWLARSPTADAVLTGGLLGAIDTEGTAAGGIAGGAGGALATGLLGRLVRPVGEVADAGLRSAGRSARALGLLPTAAQESGSRPLGMIEASLKSSPFSSGSFERIGAANQSRVNQIAAESIGESAENVTGEVLDRAATRIGKVFDSVADEPAIALGDDFINALARVESDYASAVAEPHVRKAVNDAIEGALNAATSGQVTGRAAANASSQLGKTARGLFKGAKADPEAGAAIQAIREAWDEAITRSVSPERAAALQQARQQYRNLLVLERPGVIKSPERGDISLPTLSNALRQQRGTSFTRQRGDTDLDRLGYVGRSMPEVVGDSGTASRAALPLAGAAGLLLAEDEIASGDLSGAAGQFLLPAATMAGAGLLYSNPAARRYLSRGLLPITEAQRRAAIGAGGRLGSGLLATRSGM